MIIASRVIPNKTSWNNCQACSYHRVPCESFKIVQFHLFGRHRAERVSKRQTVTTETPEQRLWIRKQKSVLIWITIWQAPSAGRMNRILRCDWLPEQARRPYLTRSGPFRPKLFVRVKTTWGETTCFRDYGRLSIVSHKKLFLFFHTVNPRISGPPWISAPTIGQNWK